jgi:hypothetical protein
MSMWVYPKRMVLSKANGTEFALIARVSEAEIQSGRYLIDESHIEKDTFDDLILIELHDRGATSQP